MAVRIDRVEREFILVNAAQAKTEARLRGAGKSLGCRIAGTEGGRVSFAHQGTEAPFAPRTRVSVSFEFRGQAVAFEAPVLSATASSIDLKLPEAMYRSLTRRWPRVSPPKDFVVEFMLPGASLSLDCPKSEEWTDIELPELREGLDSSSFAALVESFKQKAASVADECRVIMYKDKGPANVVEEMVSRLGRSLYMPTVSGQLPLTDPYPESRIVTREMAEDFEGPAALAQGSRLSTFLRNQEEEGIISAIWCPVLYFQYAVGIVYLANCAERADSLDFEALDLAWEFSRILAWFLRRHGYFSDGGTDGPRPGTIIDATPAGLLAALPEEGPDVALGSTIDLKLSFGKRSIVCSGKIARRYQEDKTRFCGLAFTDLSPLNRAALSMGLYGEDATAGDPLVEEARA